MAITRTTWVGGPAAAIYNGRTFFAREGILVTPALELAEVDSDANGVLDETAVSTPVTIRFVPSAPAADLAALYPHVDGTAGKSLFGAADVPLVLIAANGLRLTFAAVALVEMPALRLAALGAVAGTVSFLAQPRVTLDSAQMPAATNGGSSLANDYLVTWGTEAAWSGLRSRDGVRVTFKMTTKPVISDANAVVDLTLEKLEAEARFGVAGPVGPAEAEVLAALGIGSVATPPGLGLWSRAADWSATGARAGLTVSLPHAALIGAGLDYVAGKARVSELVFRAQRAEVSAA